MFRIVEDPSPPIPEICSPPMEDFLKQCFKKDPKERPSAEMLFEHSWLKTAWGEHRVCQCSCPMVWPIDENFQELRPQDSIPFLRRVSVELAKSEGRGLTVDTREPISLTDSPRESSEVGNRTPASSSQPAPLSPISPASPDGPVRNHSFIKTTFGRGKFFLSGA
jgi:serine/threonine protein kinase